MTRSTRAAAADAADSMACAAGAARLQAGSAARRGSAGGSPCRKAAKFACCGGIATYSFTPMGRIMWHAPFRPYPSICGARSAGHIVEPVAYRPPYLLALRAERDYVAGA